jgi:hypothetical protein
VRCLMCRCIALLLRTSLRVTTAGELRSAVACNLIAVLRRATTRRLVIRLSSLSSPLCRCLATFSKRNPDTRCTDEMISQCNVYCTSTASLCAHQGNPSPLDISRNVRGRGGNWQNTLSVYQASTSAWLPRCRYLEPVLLEMSAGGR